MGIKYHQYGIENDYGKDHMLTNNWNPDADYGNEYVNVSFNINTLAYDRTNSFTSNTEREQWNADASTLIKSFGIMEDCGFHVEHNLEKCAYLYAHPQQISGVVLKNDVKKIAEAIDKLPMSHIRWVDLRETVYVISDNEYEKYLDGKKDKIRKMLFEMSATTRKTKYYPLFDIAKCIADKVRLNRLGINDGKNYGSGQTIDYIMKIAHNMIDEGYLICVEHYDVKYIRCLNKTEQKKSKLYFMFLNQTNEM